MRFPYPCFPAEFEIPDDWWREAGMDRFIPTGQAFRSNTTNTFLMRDIEPPFRYPEAPKDFHGFDHTRLVSILRGFASNAEIEPVCLRELPQDEFLHRPFRYRVLDGFHRFYASVAVGYQKLPGSIL